MNAKQFIAAAAVFVAAGSAIAADAPGAASAALANATASAVVLASADSVRATNLNLPSVSITKLSGRARADVHAEAVEFVKNHKTAFAIQLEHYKN